MAKADQYLPRIAQEFLSTSRGASCGTQVRQFYAYILQQEVAISDIVPETVAAFLGQKSILDRTRHVYKCQLLTYLDFLYERKKITFDPKLLRIKPQPKAIPAPARSFVESPRGKFAAIAVRKFHEWLQQHGFTLKNLSSELVTAHLEDRLKTLAPSSGSVYRLQLFAYLEFQYRNNYISFDPAPLRVKPDNCPIPIDYRALLQNKDAAITSIARTFHKWLNLQNIAVSTLTTAHLEEFQGFRLERVSQTSARNSKNALLRYLDILYGENQISFDPQTLRQPPRGIELPEHAKTFLGHHGVVAKESTLKHYQSSLRRFYKWQKEHKRELAQLKAFDIEEFAIHLKQEDLRAVTRNGTLVCLRVYFRWLNEHGLLGENADDLIKAETFPKLPRYLPRPFPQEADRVIQERLAKTKDRYHQGLLLMRNTGVRIGELINLEFHCLQYSQGDSYFLKVPLGKLNSERLVPVDDRVLKIIKKLQRGRSEASTYLLETPRGRKTRQDCYSKALKSVCEGLELHGPAHTHRLRHTFATSMLNGGMGLVALMRILGHADHRMTLRYSAITTETMRDEYMIALKRLADKYDGIVAEEMKRPRDPLKSMRDIAKKLQQHNSNDPVVEKKKSILVRRLGRMNEDLTKLVSICKIEF